MEYHETASSELLRLCGICVEEIHRQSREGTRHATAKARRARAKEADKLYRKAEGIDFSMGGATALFGIYCELKKLVRPTQVQMDVF